MSRVGGFFGEHRRAARAGAFDCQLANAVLPPEDVPDHTHEEAHFVLAVDRGYVSAAFDERPTDKPFALVFNPSGTDHRDRFLEAGGRFLGIAFDPVISEQIASRGPVGIEGRARAIACRLGGLLVAGSDGLAIEEAALELVAEVAGRDGETRIPGWLVKVRDAIHETAGDESLSVADIAQAVGVHPVHLSRCYRKSFGHGPAKAIQLERLGRVAEAMRGEATLAQLAVDHGFADQAHLTRTFRSHWGITPSAARAALR